MQNLEEYDYKKIRLNEVVLFKGDLKKLYENLTKDLPENQKKLVKFFEGVPQMEMKHILKHIQVLKKIHSKYGARTEVGFYFILSNFDKITKNKTKDLLTIEKELKDSYMSVIV